MLDTKYKIENGQIVNRKTGKPVPEDEPVFLLRASDQNALQVMAYYNSLCHNTGHKLALAESVYAFQEFAKNHPERVKEPSEKSVAVPATPE